jgi:hypothetical protein
MGSAREAATVVQVPDNGIIIASKVHPGVTLKAGTRVEKVMQLTEGLRFYCHLDQ